ncbi:GTP cyclohydrolase I [Plasmodium knowlesi strain H]|uniref:GTP cyclohydrolase 1 n=3 Tax=Plasmodium knowlesi TaxID=5850 RepID=A0A5K1UCZ1_PLAKH|nr:GTP cyclohydrolase 1, putative [Plasmodium knowlesi strain H]AAR21604.1 GTP cyclohydrolase I [Plasmodium knowlesi]OTN64175.1 GTP cyclohydrolase I [Plasmodium knowlesi]CAA9991027.1 GTP cyclohydrolase 1, putative [Plasmodium knowlesi strain H]SBO20697.1 GTP cyclohydrolase I [Plasmodium knowlesi strain H]SBO21128.1 GTP cyclohydrolase I [Plasmodium knowlesi strain H]|eukprot:XP_002262309.1 gtp cyclohydrolase I [Plasmodium knowlesi strain H]
MFKRGDLNEEKHSGLDSVHTYGQGSWMYREAPLKDGQSVGVSGNEDQREGWKCVLNTSPMKTNLGLGLFRVKNGIENNGRGCNNCRDGDEHFSYTSQPTPSLINKDSELRYNGISISREMEKMTDYQTNGEELSHLSEEASLGKGHQNNAGSSMEASPPCAIRMEEKRGAVNGLRRKVIKRVEKKDQGGNSCDDSRNDRNLDDISSGHTNDSHNNNGNTNGCDPPPVRRKEPCGIDTPRESNEKAGTKKDEQIADISRSIKKILRSSKVPPKDILKKTGRRFSDTFLYLTKGYHMSVEKVIKKSLYKRNYKNNSVIKISGIHIYSLCKHHLLPFEGECTIEYIPNKYIMGLSKFSRVIDIFARRLQLQEDLTNDICNALGKYLKPKYLHVNLVARHLCINMRGVKEHDATTITNAYYEVKNDTCVNHAGNGFTCPSFHNGNNPSREDIAPV